MNRYTDEDGKRKMIRPRNYFTAERFVTSGNLKIEIRYAEAELYSAKLRPSTLILAYDQWGRAQCIAWNAAFLSPQSYLHAVVQVK